MTAETTVASAVASVEATAKADWASAVAALESRVTALENDAEADYQKLKAFYANAVVYVKKAGGISAVLAGGFAAAKFDVIGFVVKHIF